MRGVLVGLLAVLLAGCGGTPSPAHSSAADEPAAAGVKGSVMVFAAASLTGAFDQIAAGFESVNPGARVSINYAGSPTLRAQLAQGARADVFASADIPNMDGARADGSIEGLPSIFAHNRLTVVAPASDSRVASLQDLAKPGVKVVLELPAVPAGAYARQALGKLSKDPAFGSGFQASVLANVVSQEPDVKSVLSRIQLGEADAGLLYVSDVASPGVRQRVRTLDIPDQYNVMADYPVALVKDAPNPAAARAFMAYVLSPAGQAALEKNGLQPVS